MNDEIFPVQGSTLKAWLEVSIVLWGKDSPQAKFFEDKIAKQGEDMEVLASTGQVIYLLTHMR